MDFLRWVAALPGRDSEKDPNGVQFQEKLHKNG
jgi:hypothetical protein